MHFSERAYRSLFGLSLLILLGLAMVVDVRSARAATIDLTTSPLPISLITVPGHDVSTQLRIKNNAPQTVRLRASLYKFRALGDDGKPQIEDRAPQDTYFDWVTFSRAEFDAEPGVWKSITMNISVPKDAAFGYYYAVIFQPVGTAKLPGKSSIVGGTATLVLLDVQVPGAQPNLSVTSFKASKKFYEFLPASFSVTIHNAGNIHTVPSGNIFITRGGKRNLASLDINLGQGNILPNSNRVFTAKWADAFPVYVSKTVNGKIVNTKAGVPAQKLKWDFTQASRFRFGKYTANLLFVYDDGAKDIPIEGSLTFWVIPCRLIAAVLVIGALVAAGVWSTGRNIFRGIKQIKSRPR